MPAAVAVPLIASGIGAGISAIGSHKQASAAEKAARLQTNANRESLRFLQQQAAQEQANFQATEKANYGQYVAERGRLEPYQQLGASAAGTLQDRLGLPRVALPGNAPPPEYQNLTSGPAMPTSGQNGQSVRVGDLINTQGLGMGQRVRGLGSLASGQTAYDTVWIEGPDGSRGEVPKTDAPWWLQRGGKVVTA